MTAMFNVGKGVSLRVLITTYGNAAESYTAFTVAKVQYPLRNVSLFREKEEMRLFLLFLKKNFQQLQIGKIEQVNFRCTVQVSLSCGHPISFSLLFASSLQWATGFSSSTFNHLRSLPPISQHPSSTTPNPSVYPRLSGCKPDGSFLFAC